MDTAVDIELMTYRLFANLQTKNIYQHWINLQNATFRYLKMEWPIMDYHSAKRIVIQTFSQKNDDTTILLKNLEKNEINLLGFILYNKIIQKYIRGNN